MRPPKREPFTPLHKALADSFQTGLSVGLFPEFGCTQFQVIDVPRNGYVLRLIRADRVKAGTETPRGRWRVKLNLRLSLRRRSLPISFADVALQFQPPLDFREP